MQIGNLIVARDADNETAAAIDRAFEAFRKVEQACSRFSPDSELTEACREIGKPVQVSPYLFEPLKFALKVARRTNGRFDPTVGRVMEELGFDRHYLTGAAMHSPTSDSATYRDIVLDEQARTLILRKPLVIDLGAVAKVKDKEQVVFGMVSAVVGASVYALYGGLTYLFAGLLAGNLYRLLCKSPSIQKRPAVE